jgi:hypothetical protein
MDKSPKAAPRRAQASSPGAPVVTTPLAKVASPIARAGKNYCNVGASFPKCGTGGSRTRKTIESRKNGVAHFQLFLDKKHLGKLDDLPLAVLTDKELWSEFAGYLAGFAHHLNNTEMFLSKQTAESIYSGFKNAMAHRFPGEELFKVHPNGEVAAFHLTVKTDMINKMTKRNTDQAGKLAGKPVVRVIA